MVDSCNPRQGPARPGHLHQHDVESDGPVKPGHDVEWAVPWVNAQARWYETVGPDFSLKQFRASLRMAPRDARPAGRNARVRGTPHWAKENCHAVLRKR